MKRKAIIVDLDGTLCNADHRKHFVESEKKDWKSFYQGISDDKINEWCSEIISKMVGYTIVFVSGRPDDYRKETEDWLYKHLYGHFPLFMRESGDFRKDSIIKEEIYWKKIEPNYDVLFCIDDRKQVVDMWRSIGLTCLQCAEGNF